MIQTYLGVQDQSTPMLTIVTFTGSLERDNNNKIENNPIHFEPYQLQIAV
jgi:hypothetical protein